MKLLSAAAELAATLPAVVTREALFDKLNQACYHAGVRYFALSHHVDFAASPGAVRLHNYPPGWQEWYDANRFGLSDPIHRASQRTAKGFYWNDVADIIPLSRSDRILLGRGREIGLGDGVTIPAHVPGEARGSCSFVAETGTVLPDNALLWAQAVGMVAFEVARVINRRVQGRVVVRATERQCDCIVLAGRGLSDAGIASARSL